MKKQPAPLETLVLDQLPDEAMPAYEAALLSVSATVALFLDEETGNWRIEAVREAQADADALQAALALAAGLTGHEAPLTRHATESEGWLARTVEAFPEQEIGRRFLIRPTHVAPRPTYGRIALTLDAGLAFGSGEHASTQGCLMALERLPKRLPRVLDVGTGSGILAMGAAKLWHVKALASDLDPWSVRVTRENAAMNGLAPRLRAVLATGYAHNAITRGAPYDLIFANILARPLCAMAKDLAAHLRPGGRAILAGLLGKQVRMVLAAHRRAGLVLERRISLDPWATLVLRKPG
ncbi:50S ribosomal protein L11 methyltransferase [Sediminicoccus rosea]|jgi:ribosomal protein L11 methyltransferase|uniref:Ribosomal protein L11 methyltransferase n=1 Tax=Sediminicoccus rosea TaxID=1225128 RepID=A0ABZ0PL29_9PROT|nr:50S ribosomal protein L11 methyltransferase [Sediminicoccus rosea]WPB85795.1 50S ribosomal protein L11 methyltransferase [Sediminicoccus rosea]